MKVICINASNKPSSVPMSSWIEEGEEYTVVRVMKMAKQRMTDGFVLEEVGFPKDSEYECYTSSRFRPSNEDDRNSKLAVEELLEEILEESLELI